MSQMERLFYIDRSIRNTGCVTLDDIMKRFEVSRRQAKRDIEYLRDRLDAPIVWNRYKRRYEYAMPWNKLQFADEKQFLALAFIEAILRRLYYVPFFSEQLVQALKHQLGSRYASIADKVRYELPYFEDIDIKVVSELSHSLMESRVVSILYRDASGRESQRDIVALRMVNYGGKWYCVALDSLSGELRVFAVSRISQPKVGAKARQPLPTHDEIEQYLSASYGIFKGEPIGTAVLRFHGGAARAIRDQTWHPQQKVEYREEPEPVLQMSLPVHDWTEVLGRALRCGSDCEVLDPPEFRARWKAEIMKMLARTGQETP